MLKLFVATFIFLVSPLIYATDENFNITLSLVSRITITENSELSFPNSSQEFYQSNMVDADETLDESNNGKLNLGFKAYAGSKQKITIHPGDAGAADFSATGFPNVCFTKSIVETSINLTTGDGTSSSKQVLVDTFTLAGPSCFNSGGVVAGLKIGATAHISSDDQPGNYVGSATFRIVY